MVTEAFNEAWNSLSPVQREAAEWTDGALLVLAGPGSGKTNVLTTRIAKLLSESPESKYRILALTFTNKAASEMRERVDKFAPGQYSRAFIGTFHSFCADVVRQHGVHLEIQPNFKIYSEDDDLNSILSDAVAEARKTSAIVTDLDKKLLPVIKRLKSFLIEPDNAIDAFSDKEFGARVAVVYPAYEAELRKHNVLDFESLVLEAYRLFSRF